MLTHVRSGRLGGFGPCHGPSPGLQPSLQELPDGTNRAWTKRRTSALDAVLLNSGIRVRAIRRRRRAIVLANGIFLALGRGRVPAILCMRGGGVRAD